MVYESEINFIPIDATLEDQLTDPMIELITRGENSQSTRIYSKEYLEETRYCFPSPDFKEKNLFLSFS